MALHTVTTTHLELRSPAALRRARETELRIERASVPAPELNRFLYTAVGGDWYWIDRLSWDYAGWRRYLERPQVHTFVALCGGSVAGYFELEEQGEQGVEIAYFGLLPQFVGRGFGGHLLTRALEEGFARAPHRVWVHTCDLDGPQALRNYQARGMTVFLVETRREQLPERSPGPWPGSGRDTPPPAAPLAGT